MRIFNLLLIISSTCTIALSQNADSGKNMLKSMLQLDTIIYLDEFNEFYRFKELEASFSGNNLYVGYLKKNPEVDATTELIIHRYEIYAGYKKTTFTIKLDQLNVDNPNMRLYRLGAIAAKGDTLAVLFSEHLFLFLLNKGAYDYLTMKKIKPAEDLRSMKFTANGLWNGSCYNGYNPFVKTHPSRFGLRATSNLNPIKTEKFPFKGIEFSHFDPNHWIDASNSRILSTQTLDYEITVYSGDSGFTKTGFIQRNVPGWQRMDSLKLATISRSHSKSDAIGLIKDLEPYHNGKISRLEGAWFINDTTILSRYIMPDSKAEGFVKYKHFCDLWVLRSGSWILKVQDMEDEENEYNSNIEREVKKEDVDVLSWLYPFYISETFAITIRNQPKVQPYGATPKEIREQNKRYLKSGDPAVALFFYKMVK